MDIGSYFEKSWRPEFSKYKYSGWSLLNKVSLKDRLLDVGCGYNLFKPIFRDAMVGIDPYNDAADIRVSIEDYKTDEQFDAVFCLGSLNFGDRGVISKQIAKVATLIKPGGRVYWRQNPGVNDHQWTGAEVIDFFPWSFEKNLSLAKEHGFHVDLIAWDLENRIYSEWIKL
jgi:SAM-dependent methyltransferase